MSPVQLATLDWGGVLSELDTPLDLDRLLPGSGPWEVEIGSGKGRYMLRRAVEEPAARFLAIEVAGRYFRMMRHRMRRRGAANLLLLRGEALYLMSVALPAGFAAAVHVYFPDPWPKAKHHKRRLFDVETVDLVLGLLEPGGRLFFATDFLDYGELVAELLATHPDLRLRRRKGPWEGGPRTNYEAKYVSAGRPIVRLEAERASLGSPLHPRGEAAILSGHEPGPQPVGKGDAR